MDDIQYQFLVNDIRGVRKHLFLLQMCIEATFLLAISSAVGIGYLIFGGR